MHGAASPVSANQVPSAAAPGLAVAPKPQYRRRDRDRAGRREDVAPDTGEIIALRVNPRREKPRIGGEDSGGRQVRERDARVEPAPAGRPEETLRESRVHPGVPRHHRREHQVSRDRAPREEAPRPGPQRLRAGEPRDQREPRFLGEQRRGQRGRRAEVVDPAPRSSARISDRTPRIEKVARSEELCAEIQRVASQWLNMQRNASAAARGPPRPIPAFARGAIPTKRSARGARFRARGSRAGSRRRGTMRSPHIP